MQQRISAAEDIPLENLSRSSTPVLGGKPIPIAVSVNSAGPFRDSPKKNHSFDGGISVSSSPSTSILGSSAGMGVSPAVKTIAAVLVSQETSFMGGRDDKVAEEGEVGGEEGAIAAEEVEQQQQQQPQGARRKGTIETV